MQEPEKKKKNIPALIGIVAGGLTMILVQQFFFKAPSYDQQMMSAASEINKSCPMMVDQETRLDNAVALPENVFQYNYTLVNMEKASTDASQLENYLKPILINNVKSNPDMKINRDNKTTMGYYYKDKNGEFLFKVLVTPDLYDN
ncbi:MAG: hypothetical protein RIG68_07505 [Imperialibacter sp.]|uniref:hypothetical protein n=1 Tax=Imperialibacter sp. TaxID=2038411 RepID=UPI0032F09663